MALPIERTVTGKYVNPVTGEPYDGVDGEHYVVFEPVPERWIDQSGDQVLVGAGRVNLERDGTFAEALVCTDAPGVIPAEGRLWRMRQYVGGVWETQYFVLPRGDGSDVDITDLLSVDVSGITYVPMPGPPGEPGRVQSVNGHREVDIVLAAGDVGAIPVEDKGLPGGVAALDASGKVPLAQLPVAAGGSGVDSVNDLTGAVTLAAADVGADPAGSAEAVRAALESHAGSVGAGFHLPPGGSSGQVLARSGAAVQWIDPPAGGVTSVNGQSGAVTLGADDVGALAASRRAAPDGVASLDADGRVPVEQLPDLPSDVTSVNGQVGAVALTAADVDAVGRAERGVPNGVATLGADGLVSSDQLPVTSGGDAVSSVNGETGVVTLDATDVGAVPAAEKGAPGGVAQLGADGRVPASQLPPPVADAVSSVNGQTGAVALSAADVGADPSGAAQAVQGALDAHLGATGAGAHLPTGGAEGQVLTRTGGQGAQWSTPPTAPVSSVNGQTGAVTLAAADVDALPAAQKGVANGVASLGGDGRVPSAQLPAQAVTSVNTKTGAVSLTAADVGAIATTQQGVANGVATLGADGLVTPAQLPAAPVTSVNSKTGAVSLTATDVGALATSAKGVANGVASLGADGRIPLAQTRQAVFNVLDYGVVRNGTTNDGPAIQDALNAANAAGGGTVVIPPGVYGVSTFLVVYEDCTIWAYGATLRAIGNAGLLRNFLGSDVFSGYAGRSNIKIFGGIWDGNASDGVTGTVTGMTNVMGFVHCSNIRVQDATIRNVSSAHALEFNSTNGGVVLNCRFEGFRDNSGTNTRGFAEAVQIDMAKSGSSSIGAFDNTPSKNILVQGCYFGPSSRLGVFGRAVGSHTVASGVYYDNIQVIGNRIEGAIQEGVHGYGWRRAVISKNIITSTGKSGVMCTVPDPVGAGYALTMHSLNVEGNTIDSPAEESGIRVAGYATAEASLVRISSNTIRGADTGAANGIHTEYCVAPGVTGNSLSGVPSSGIYAVNSTLPQVNNNTIRSSGSNAINVTGCTGGQVDGNLVFTTATNYGVFVGTSDAVSVTNNRITGAALAGIRLNGATDCFVTHNMIRRGGVSTNGITLAASATGAVIVGNDMSGNSWSGTTALVVSTAAPVTDYAGGTAVPGHNFI